MTKAREFFRKQGFGSIRKCAREIGYNERFLAEVISHTKKCSIFTATCISDWTHKKLELSDFLIGETK